MPRRKPHSRPGTLYKDAYRSARRAVPGARDLLEALQGRAAVGVLSDHRLAAQREKLRELRLDGYVDELVVSEEVEVPKPDPRMFRTALERPGCAEEETVMVGDSWERDVVGAHGVGMRAVWLNRYAGPCPDPALAAELRSLLPTEDVLSLLLDGEGPAQRR